MMGGRILKGSTSVYVDGRPVGLHPSPITPHPPGGIHKSSKTLIGSTSVMVQNQPVLYVGAQTLCGHTIMTGSTSVIIGK
jgi:uncharacterized Zn-binding protein involved in type VI secretion